MTDTNSGFKFRDLGLDYNAAAHGVQSAIKFEIERDLRSAGLGPEAIDALKHLRVGIDSRAADTSGIAGLLMKKGVFTLDEYTEHMRLAMNEELARYEQHVRARFNLPDSVNFR